MEIKKVWAMYFSPTGGTQKAVQTVAEDVAKQLEIPFEVYDFTLPQKREEVASFTETDLVFLGTPVIAGRVPNVLLPYLDTIVGSGAYGVPMVSFGNRNFDDALIELRDIMEKDGFRTIAGGAFVSEHSFSYILSAGRPDAQDYAVMHAFADDIVKKCKSDFVYEAPAFVEGETPIRPYFKPQDRYGKHIDIRKVKPKTSDACCGCGICAEVCPMGSIDADTFECVRICIKCNACVKKCPSQAKYFDDPGYIYHKEELEELYEGRSEPKYFV